MQDIWGQRDSGKVWGSSHRWVQVQGGNYIRGQLLFAMVMDRVTGEVRQESPWTMILEDDIVICSKRAWRGEGVHWREEEWKPVEATQNTCVLMRGRRWKAARRTRGNGSYGSLKCKKSGSLFGLCGCGFIRPLIKKKTITKVGDVTFFLSFRNEKIALRNFNNDMAKTSMSRTISSDVSMSIVMVRSIACNYQMEPHRFGKFLFISV